MREIKFKAFSQKNNAWNIAFSIHSTGLYSDLVNGEIVNQTPVCNMRWQDLAENNDIILVQYTGLKSRSGDLIYEGDILEFKEIVKKSDGTFFALKESIRCAVIFEDGCFGIRGFYHLDNPITTFDFVPLANALNMTYIQNEIVGNIFDGD